MPTLNQEIGQRIRQLRKQRGLTLLELSQKLYKSVATLSKYEKGEIVLDVPMLYALAKVFDVSFEQLLVPIQRDLRNEVAQNIPTFFRHLTQFYAYFYDGRNNKVVASVVDLIDHFDNQFKVAMYMNYHNLKHYQECENCYVGTMVHFDALTHIQLINQHLPMEQASIQILASQLESEQKWGYGMASLHGQ